MRTLILYILLCLFYDMPLIAYENDLVSNVCQWKYDNFYDFKSHFIQFISKSKNIVWLISNYLTDGDVVASLFLASYRKLDVRVLLGVDRAYDYMSRLNYLKENSIPVYSRPKGLYDDYATVLITDQLVLVSKSNLDFLSFSKEYYITDISKDVQAFKSNFIDAFNKNHVIKRSKVNKTFKRVSSKPVHNIKVVQPNFYTETNIDVYNYDKYAPQINRPGYMPSKLPKHSISNSSDN